MYGLTTIMGIIKCEGRTRGLAAVAMFIFLSALPMDARAQDASANTGGGLQLEMSMSLRGALNVSPFAGQTVRILIEAADAAGTSLREPSEEPGVLSGAGGVQVRAFSGSTGALLWSRGFTSLTPGLNTIEINRNELPEVGESGTGRLDLWIEVVILPSSIRSGQMDEVIVVGIYNTSSR